MNDVSLTVASVFGGCLMGLYLVGFFVRWVDGTSVNIALFLAVAFNLYLGLGVLGALPAGWKLDVHGYWTTTLVNGAFILLACGISLVRRRPPNNVQGLTAWTPDPAGKNR